MSGHNLLDRLAAEVLVLDGAMGTMLFDAGLGRGGCPEEWNQTRPDVIRAIHLAYLDAGSDILETNSFGGTAPKNVAAQAKAWAKRLEKQRK